MKLSAIVVIVLIFAFSAAGSVAFAEESSAGGVPDRYGMAIVGGNTYDPANNITFVQLSGFALFEHGKVWRCCKGPEALRFKVEGNIGVTTRPDTRLIVSANMFTLYYLNALSSRFLRPYVEGGIGLIYTDFQVEGQGLRFNFNPQLGIGAEIDPASEKPLFIAARLHHISNGGLYKDNRGVNSVTLTVGRFF